MTELLASLPGIEVFLLASLATIIGSILQASVGYGFGLVTVPMLLLLDKNFAPVPTIFASQFLMLMIAHRNRFALDGHSMKPLLIGLVVGAPLGAFIALHIDHELLVYCVAVLVAAGLLISILRARIRVTPVSQFFAGTAANVLGTITGIGGVPMALLYQHESAGRIRAVLATTFFIGGALSLTALAVTSQVSGYLLMLGCYLIPGILVGNLIGARCAQYIDRGYSRLAILLLTSCSLAYLLFDVTFGNHA